MEIGVLSLLFGIYVFALFLFLSGMIFHSERNLENQLEQISRMGRRGIEERQGEKKKRIRRKRLLFILKDQNNSARNWRVPGFG